MRNWFIRLGGFPVRLALCVAAAIAINAAVASAQPQQMGQSGLSWQQRFLGILPLVKPDPKDPVVVTVNGTPITAAQITDYAKTEARLINANTTDEMRAVYKDATENLINRQLLIDEAQRRHITIPEAEVAERAREFQVQGIGGETVSTGSAPDPILLAQVRSSMEIEKMLDELFREHKSAPSEADITKYYDEHKDLFVEDPGEVRISHIAVKLPDKATDQQKKQAETAIKHLQAEAAKGVDFAELARKNSQDEHSAPKGGDLGYFRKGQLPPVVDNLAFETPVGHVSPIIESNLGYSFLKVTDRRGVTYAPLKSVKAKIAIALLDFNQEYEVKELLKKLAKSAKIKFNRSPGSESSIPPIYIFARLRFAPPRECSHTARKRCAPLRVLKMA
ncbi:MAG TPA: peptidylprolyl isomerase [Candidatus Binataceae bacterium]|nr:peptidylprolyl isomerase [Candidatus Binataceae bacterium]